MAEHKALAPTLQAGPKALGIVPRNFDDVYRMAKVLAASNMVPADFRGKPEATAVAVMQGLELGLSPVSALQSIAVINGRPSLWGDGALGIVRGSGLCEMIRETYDEETGTATCSTRRVGESVEISRSFSIEDAKAAKLWGKAGPWQTYPKRMLQMRARSWCLRDAYADVFKGLHIAEEAQDMEDITPEAEPKRKSAAESKRDGSDRVFNEICAHIRGCSDWKEINFIRETYAKEWQELPRKWVELMDMEIETQTAEWPKENEAPQEAGEVTG